MKIATSFILAFLFSNLLFAQNNKREMDQKKPFVLGVIDSLYSDILHETRTVNIYLPRGYSDSSATYPVIYLLDGSAAFQCDNIIQMGILRKKILLPG